MQQYTYNYKQQGLFGKVKQNRQMRTVERGIAILCTLINEHLFNGVSFEKISECAREKYKKENPSKRARIVNGLL